MKCKKCGKEIPENSEFCTYCGNKVDKNSDNKKIIINTVYVVSGIVGFILILAIAMYSMNSNSTTVVSDNDFENNNVNYEKKDKEIFDYIAKELPKIIYESQPSIFMVSDEEDGMVAINSVKAGTAVYNGQTIYFLNAEPGTIDIDIALKDDSISNILLTLNYMGQYYEAYVRKPQLRYYYGKIKYDIDVSNYSNIIPQIDSRYINDVLAASNGVEPNVNYSNGHFSTSLENGNYTNTKFTIGSRNIDIDNQKLGEEYQKYIEENLSNIVEQDDISNETIENRNNSIIINSEIAENNSMELTQEEKKNKAKEALETIHTEIYAGEGADISETYLSPISYGITAYYTIYDNDDINYRIEKVVAVNQQTGISTEVIHNNEYNSIGSAKVDLVDGTNMIMFTFYDNYGNTKQESKTVNKLNF